MMLAVDAILIEFTELEVSSMRVEFHNRDFMLIVTAPFRSILYMTHWMFIHFAEWFSQFCKNLIIIKNLCDNHKKVIYIM